MNGRNIINASLAAALLVTAAISAFVGAWDAFYPCAFGGACAVIGSYIDARRDL